MTAFLSLDDTTPPSGFVHWMAGCAASGGQVAEQDIVGMAPRPIVSRALTRPTLFVAAGTPSNG